MYKLTDSILWRQLNFIRIYVTQERIEHWVRIWGDLYFTAREILMQIKLYKNNGACKNKRRIIGGV